MAVLCLCSYIFYKIYVTRCAIWYHLYNSKNVENTHWGVLLLVKLQGFKPEACNFIKKETLTQVFSCKFCEISKNPFFTEHLRTTASETKK